jgi:hypothetical protein
VHLCVSMPDTSCSEWSTFSSFFDHFTAQETRNQKQTEDSPFFIYVRCRNFHLSINIFLWLFYFISINVLFLLFLLFILYPYWISIPIVHLLCEGIGRAVIINWYFYIILIIYYCEYPYHLYIFWSTLAALNYQLIFSFYFIYLLFVSIHTNCTSSVRRHWPRCNYVAQ